MFHSEGFLINFQNCPQQRGFTVERGFTPFNISIHYNNLHVEYCNTIDCVYYPNVVLLFLSFRLLTASSLWYLQTQLFCMLLKMSPGLLDSHKLHEVVGHSLLDLMHGDDQNSVEMNLMYDRFVGCC